MKNAENTQFPRILTENLILRKLKISDKSDIFAIRSHKRIAEYLDRPLCKSFEEAQHFINKINDGVEKDEWFYWAVTDKIDSAFMGTICLWNFSEDRSVAEVGFEMLPFYQGKGIMREALGTIIHLGFEKLQLISIEGMVHKENLRSIKLLEKNGFELKGETDSAMLTYHLVRN